MISHMPSKCAAVTPTSIQGLAVDEYGIMGTMDDRFVLMVHGHSSHTLSYSLNIVRIQARYT